MDKSWKYYLSRISTGILVLLIVIFIISASFTFYNYERRKVDVRNTLISTIEHNSTIENMTYAEREEWKDNKTTELRKRFGIDQSYWEVTIANTLKVFQGDFGRSYSLHTSEPPVSYEVLDIIVEVFPYTVLLYGTSAFIYTILGLFWGLRSAQQTDGKSNIILEIGSMISSSMPMWWLGMLLLIVFSFRLSLFPGAALPFPRSSGLDYYIGVIHRMTLPIVTIVLTMFGARAWSTKHLISDILHDNYIMAARGKGLSEKNIIYKHALKTASPTIVSNALRSFLLTMPALVITEAIFGWPGLGWLYYRATIDVMVVDIPVIMGLTFFNAALYITIWLISDIVSGFLDPRIKLNRDKR